MRLAIFLLSASSVFSYVADDGAKTIVTDGTQSDTQAAVTYVDGKNQDGWVMTIGTAGGSYTWTSAVNMASTFVHSFTIQGAGGSGNRTTITADFTSGGQAMGIRATPGKLTKVQYFIFTTASGESLGSGFIAVDATSTSTATNAFWIENCTFSNCQSFGIVVIGPNISGAGAVYGLIDLCTFSASVSTNGIYVFSGNDGDNWDGDMTWGTVSTVCIEDNTFTKTGAVVEGNPAIDSSYNGARWLARRNTFTNWVCVAHGADSAPTSTLQVEFYDNTVTVDENVDYALYLRGGAAMVTDNVVTVTGAGSYNSLVKFAQDSDPADFQQVGDGAVGGVETIVGTYIWDNDATGVTSTVANAGTLAQNTNWFLVAPGPGLPTTSYTELVYPHPLRDSPATSSASMSGTVSISGNASIK